MYQSIIINTVAYHITEENKTVSLFKFNFLLKLKTIQNKYTVSKNKFYKEWENAAQHCMKGLRKLEGNDFTEFGRL